MRIGQHLLTRRDGSFLIRFPAVITKNHRDLEYPLAPEPARLLRDYLTLARPQLPGSGDTDRLWLGTTGDPLTLCGLEGLIKRRNRDFTGMASGPHMERKWLTDSARNRSPEAAFDAAEVLGHSPETALEHYAQAVDLHAGKRHRRRMSRLRRQTAGLARRAFGECAQQRRKKEGRNEHHGGRADAGGPLRPLLQ